MSLLTGWTSVSKHCMAIDVYGMSSSLSPYRDLNMNGVQVLTLYQPMTHNIMCHEPIRIYMGGLILGVNTLYRLFCLFKLFPMVGKGLIKQWLHNPYMMLCARDVCRI